MDKHFWFKIASIIYIFVAFPHVYYTMSLHYKIKEVEPTFPWPDLQEMWLVVLITFICCVGRVIFISLFSKAIITCAKDDGKLSKEEHARKASKYVYNCLLFTISSLYGYYVLKDSHWLPWYLGGAGSGDYKGISDNAPFVKPIPNAVQFGMLSFGVHFSIFVS